VAFEEVIQTPERTQLEELLHGTGLHGTRSRVLVSTEEAIRYALEGSLGIPVTTDSAFTLRTRSRRSTLFA